MRMDEVMANPADQLALWRLISDSVWAGIAKQAREKAMKDAAAKRAAKNKPKRPSVPRIPSPAAPPPFPKPKPLNGLTKPAQQPSISQNQQQPSSAPISAKPSPTANGPLNTQKGFQNTLPVSALQSELTRGRQA